MPRKLTDFICKFPGGLGISSAPLLVLQVEPVIDQGPWAKAMSNTKQSDADAARHTRRHPLETACRILESRLEYVDSVEKTALDIAGRAGFHGTDLEKIGVAVHEVVANAIGNHLECQKKLIVTIIRTVEKFGLAVWDQGEGFDLQSLPDPRNTDALLLPCGRGVYLARAFMDEFYVDAGPGNGTTVTMIKYIPSMRRLGRQV